MANSVLGTPMYMAPEQFMGRTIDHRVDLYGAGVVLYQLVAGRPPFVGTPESLMYRVVNDMPLPPSAAEGAMHGDRFDRAVATALAKDPSERYASAAAFRNAVSAALGQPVPPAVSQEAVYALPMPTEYAPTERIAPLHATGSAPTHWDPAVLAQVEATLARHVGPLAGVLVRRASRLCHDLPALQAALAEQITNVGAREAFLGSRSGAAGGTGGATGGSAGSRASGTNFQGSGARAPAPAPSTYGSMAMGAPVSDALLEQVQRLMATHLGPIARVVVKRAADRTRQRQPLFALLAEAVPEAARAKLLSELSRLG
jgi:serine/threonine-protein kinase